MFSSFQLELNLWASPVAQWEIILQCVCYREVLQLKILSQSIVVSVVCFRIPPSVYCRSFIYVICFLFYAVPNCKHATSNFPFSSSKPCLFSLECLQTHLDVLRSCHLHAVWDHTGFDRENWHLGDLMRKGSPSTFQTWKMPSHCPVEWVWATMRQNGAYSVILWWCGWAFFE